MRAAGESLGAARTCDVKRVKARQYSGVQAMEILRQAQLGTTADWNDGPIDLVVTMVEANDYGAIRASMLRFFSPSHVLAGVRALSRFQYNARVLRLSPAIPSHGRALAPC